MAVFFDIEANGFLPEATKVWCIVVYDTDTKQWHEYRQDSDIQGLCRQLLMEDTVIGHNLIGYDLPLLRKLYDFEYEVQNWAEDTMIMSSLFNPDREGGHSLGSWGQRLGYPKGDQPDFSVWSEEMMTYCKRDVEVTIKTYERLQHEL